LRAFARGLYPAVPAVPTASLDVVSVDYVTDAIYALCEASGGVGETYHLAAGSMASNVAELAELAGRYFKRPPPRVLDPDAFADYAGTLSETQGNALREGAVYFPYLSVRTEFDNACARARLEPAGINASPLSAYLERLLDFATRTRWGKRPVSRFEALAA
jgi:nucleoside-diphosphate-sugar epimerase